MNNNTKNKNALRDMQCPVCYESLFSGSVQDVILCPKCKESFPVISGIPIMINDKSVFRREDFTNHKNLFFDLSRTGQMRASLSAMLPSLVTGSSKKQFDLIKKLLDAKKISNERVRVLVLGGSILGGGMKNFVNDLNADFVHSDVSFGPMTDIVLDAHAIPYANDTFDVVIAQAVLEHVADPYQCVAEIHRVLRMGGLVFADIPFMQQVHGAAYDFTRFTRNGQRKLFSCFREIESGASSGSGSALAWAYQYLLLGLFGYTPTLRYAMKAFARITGFWIKYFDYLETKNPYRADGASVIYFIGEKSDTILSDRDIVNTYWNDIQKKNELR